MKKLISLFLALLLLLAALPAAALAEDLDEVPLTVAVPQDGQAPDEAAPTLSTDKARIYAYDWKDSKGARMTMFDSFRQGETYTLVVVVTSTRSFTDKTKVLVNGEPVAWEDFGTNSIRFARQFTAAAQTRIDGFTVTVKEPAVGEHASLDAVITGADLEVKEVSWTNGTSAELDDSHIFEAGRYYMMWISVAPKDPSAHFREHDGWPEVVIHCAQAEVYNPHYSVYHPDWLTFGLDFDKLDTQTIPALGFTGVTPPAEGVTPAYDVTLVGAHYKLSGNVANGFRNGVRWFDLTTGAMAAYSDVGTLLPFRGGHQYRLDLEVVSDDGWSFDPAATTATVNGQSAVLEGVKTRVTVSYIFPALEENQVIGSIDLSVPAPVIGEKPSYAVGVAGAGLHRAAVNDGYTQDGVKWYRDSAFMAPGAAFGCELVYTVQITLECDSGYEFAAAGGKYAAAATVNGQSAEASFDGDGKRAVVRFSFPKIDRVLDHIEIVTPPERTAYRAGEHFDPAGMEVLAVYTDLATAPVGFAVTPEVLSEGDTFVTVSYTEGSVTAAEKLPIEVGPARTLAALTVTKAPAKTVYKPGEKFDPAGMELTATFTDGTAGLVKPTEISPKLLTEADAFVTLSYTEGGVTKTATVAVTVKAGDKPDKKENPFTDVKESDYFYDAVLWACYATPQVTNGVGGGLFAPDSTVTRGQAVTFLWRAVGCPEPESQGNPFADVPESEYYYKAVLWAVEKGVTKGTDDTHFTPDQTCSTAHILTFLFRTLGVGADGWYAEAEAWARGAGLLTGLDIAVAPGVDCPRADVVLFLYRAVGE